MNIVQDVDALRTQRSGSLCVLATSTDTELATQAATELGLDLPEGGRTLRRPSAAVGTSQVDLVVFTIGDDRRLVPVQIFAARDGFLVVASEPVLELLRAQIRDDHDDVWSAVVTVLLCLAQRSQDVLDGMVDDSRQLETQASGFTAAPQRREMARLREQLFEVTETEDAQLRLLGPEEELYQSLNEDQQRQLKRAAVAFDGTRSMAAQLYARLGDVLDQQATVISERLTLVATIFFPLSLVTAFFGMSFNWMLQRIESLSAFIGLGIVAPVLLMLLTLVLLRRLTRSS